VIKKRGKFCWRGGSIMKKEELLDEIFELALRNEMDYHG
jgi:hypothetical protein